ncbi:unnamed protein product [Euphydryas editha]|uniref:Tyrosine-protein phosphatase domain-containing protein n=1 Tax=Euphydryas editha TaxID=104508 RepID=A0AAU9UKW6_EUPED|nr:unnamed protein product [Euphydryas editha]
METLAQEYSEICQLSTYEHWKSKNIIRSRVVLQQARECDLQRKYIATEEPITSNLENLWNKIRKKNTRVIVMINGSEQESDPYISPSQNEIIAGDFKIKTIERNEEIYYTETIIIITHLPTGRLNKVSHFKYLNWPENEFPHGEEIMMFLGIINKKYEYE